MKQLKEKLKILIERMDNCLFMSTGPTSNTIPDSIHKEGLVGTMKDIKQELTDMEETIGNNRENSSPDCN